MSDHHEYLKGTPGEPISAPSGEQRKPNAEIRAAVRAHDAAWDAYVDAEDSDTEPDYAALFAEVQRTRFALFAAIESYAQRVAQQQNEAMHFGLGAAWEELDRLRAERDTLTYWLAIMLLKVGDSEADPRLADIRPVDVRALAGRPNREFDATPRRLTQEEAAKIVADWHRARAESERGK